MPRSPRRSQRLPTSPRKAEEPQSGHAEPTVASRVTDNRDGTFCLEWWAKEAGSYEVFVKLDGLHVLGSPAVLRMYKDEETFKRCAPTIRAAATRPRGTPSEIS